MKKNQTGFSLIELLIVVVIIGIIAAIAIPNLLAARRSANEASAVASMRTLTGAQATYSSSVGANLYGTGPQLNTAGLIDNTVYTTTGKSGYIFTITPIAPVTGVSPAFYDTSAVPVQFGAGIAGTGSRSFATNESGVIYFDPSNAAPTFNATTRVVSGGTPLNN